MESSNLSCAICLERYNVPVTIPCGHTFCKGCITVHWDMKAEGGYDIQCPICNEKFNPRPTLKRNVSLSRLTETEAHCVETGGAIPVSRQSNTSVPPEAVCERHMKPLVIYCRNDSKCVCYECAIRECNKHDKVVVEVEREKREEGLKKKSEEVEKHMDDTENSITELTENIAKAKVSLQQTSQWMNAKFAQLVKVLAEKQESTVNFIEQERQTALAQAEAQLTTLQDRAQRLRETQGQMAALTAMPDIQFIQESRLVEVPRMKETSVNVDTNLQDKLATITEALSRISKLVLEDLEKAIHATVGQDKQGSPQDKRPVLAVVPSPATPCYPAVKEGLSAFHCALTFDPRTANANLQLSQGNQRAEHLTSGPRPVPAHEARFDTTWQVLCFQGFTHGQHYWEVEVSKPWAYLGVTYQGIPRKEKSKRCMVGMNELSWSLQLDERQLSAWHNGRKEAVAGQPQQHRIGMLLDYEAGTLTYYGNGQARLHAFHCAFSQELFPACWIGEGVSVTLCPP